MDFCTSHLPRDMSSSEALTGQSGVLELLRSSSLQEVVILLWQKVEATGEKNRKLSQRINHLQRQLKKHRRVQWGDADRKGRDQELDKGQEGNSEKLLMELAGVNLDPVSEKESLITVLRTSEPSENRSDPVEAKSAVPESKRIDLNGSVATTSGQQTRPSFSHDEHWQDEDGESEGTETLEEQSLRIFAEVRRIRGSNFSPKEKTVIINELLRPFNQALRKREELKMKEMRGGRKKRRPPESDFYIYD